MDLLKEIINCPLRTPIEEQMKAYFSPIKEDFGKKILYALSLDKDIKPTLEYNKRMRPFLIRWSSQAAGLTLDDDFVKLARDIEMKHQATLIIDDIQDWWKLRCWRKPTYIKYWIKTALNIAYLLAVSWPVQLTKKYFWTKWNLLHDYSQFRKNCFINLVSWQELDLSANGSKRSIKDYYDIADWKTGELINLALHYWTMPYEYLYSKEKSEAITRFSMIFARLYQILDDMKDVETWTNLDSSNIFHYVRNYEELNNLYNKLRGNLVQHHNIIKKLWVVKDDRLLDVIDAIIQKKFAP